MRHTAARSIVGMKNLEPYPKSKVHHYVAVWTGSGAYLAEGDGRLNHLRRVLAPSRLETTV
jgi:hypothetical protein